MAGDHRFRKPVTMRHSTRVFVYNRPSLRGIRSAIAGLVLLTGIWAAAADQASAERGEYLVALLSCGYCHTPGGMEGNPDSSRELGGSSIGIAYTAHDDPDRPGIIFPSNLTPHSTGLGRWSDDEIARVIRTGIDRHGEQQLPVMPWRGYAFLKAEDVDSIVLHLRTLKPVRFKSPDEVPKGEISEYPWVRFGVYVFDPAGDVAEKIIGTD